MVKNSAEQANDLAASAEEIRKWAWGEGSQQESQEEEGQE